MSASAPTAPAAARPHYLFSEEHEVFRRTVRRFVEEEISPHADEWEKAGRFPKSLFRRAGELGLFGICVPEKYGGIGADVRYTVVCSEELGRAHAGGVAMGLMAHSEIATPHLTHFGTDAQRERYLPDLVSGKKVGALGVTEPGGGSDVAAIRTTARRDGDNWVLNGSKIFITNGIQADLFFIAAKTDPEANYKGVSMFLVPAEAEGFTREELKNKLGMRSSDTGLLTFENVRLPADALIGNENEGFYQIMHCFQNERLVASAAAIGTLENILQKTVRYVQERPMRGQMLSDMQVTKHRLAKHYTELEACRHLVYYTAWKLAEGWSAVTEVSMAKAFVADTSCAIIDDCLQLHGGYGYLAEYGIERAWRDMRLFRIGGGATEVMYEIIAKALRI